MDSVKLSVTVQAALVAKYSAPALGKINVALLAWIAAEKARGITTVHVALDDAVVMAAHGVKAVAGRVTALKVKRAIDALARKLAPDYFVLIGGDDVLPYFHVRNPSYDPQGDTDRMVPTDNPYACSAGYRSKSLKSYLVPDRVLGRIPDLPAGAGAGDPAWIVEALKTATGWSVKSPGFYATAYAACCDQWKGAGLATMQYLGLPAADLLLSPPVVDAAPTLRSRLARTVHFTKCHGAEFNANFFGQKGQSYPEVLFSGTLQGRVPRGALAAAMCCYGAQVYSPSDPLAAPAGALPMAMTYLAGGAAGFMGATKIAWVGLQVMMCADWIVASYLKKAVSGASLGRAMLEAKQDYMQYLVNQGQRADTADEKTMIEFVLLGDPALQPVASTVVVPARSRLAALAQSQMQRRDRRVARAAVAAQVTRVLPHRIAHATPSAALARKLFKAVSGVLAGADAAAFKPGRASASKLVTASAVARATRSLGPVGAAQVHGAGDSLEYRWTGRKEDRKQVLVQLLTVQTDLAGNVLRTRLLHSA